MSLCNLKTFKISPSSNFCMIGTKGFCAKSPCYGGQFRIYLHLEYKQHLTYMAWTIAPNMATKAAHTKNFIIIGGFFWITSDAKDRNPNNDHWICTPYLYQLTTIYLFNSKTCFFVQQKTDAFYFYFNKWFFFQLYLLNKLERHFYAGITCAKAFL